LNLPGILEFLPLVWYAVTYPIVSANPDTSVQDACPLLPGTGVFV